MLAFGEPANAQPATTTSAAVNPAFNAQFDQLEPRLVIVEQNFAVRTARANATRVITSADMDDSGHFAAVEAYASGIKAAFDEALKDANAAASSKGTAGNVQNLQRLEDVLKAHAGRLQRLQAQSSNIESQIRSGSVQLDRAVLQRATPQERVDFQNVLTPSARADIQLKHPNLFPRSSLDFFNYAWLFAPARPSLSHQPANPKKRDTHWGVHQIANWIVPPAEAALAAPCLPICTALDFFSCGACVEAAGPVAINDYNAMVSCWNGAGKPWWMPNWVWQPGCVVVFVAALA
jgi:hypothetical protein